MKRFVFSTLSGLLLAICPEAKAINTVDTGFQVAPNELKTIVAHGVCKKVWNRDSQSHFVATKTSMEWTNFYVNHPAILTLNNCVASCSNLKKMGQNTSGVYTLEIPGVGSMPLYCDMTSDNGGWTRVFKHNVSAGYFASAVEAKSVNTSDPENAKYSILTHLDKFKAMNRFTFRMFWPSVNKRNIWSQMTNPTYDSDIMGYRGLSIDDSAAYWGGLELSSRSNGISTNSSLIDGSIEHSNWWYAIGSFVAYGGGGIPGPPTFESGSSEVRLYVHDGGYYPTSCQHILEMGESKGSGIYTIYPDQKTPIDTYCEMTVDNGGWTLFYANAADPAMTIKKSYLTHLSEKAGIPVTSANMNSANTVGMLNIDNFSATQMMARDVANWGATEFSTVEFQNPSDLKNFVEFKLVPSSDGCTNIAGGGLFRFRNSKGMNYLFDKMNDYGATSSGIGWGDCLTIDQTDATDVENYPRHWIYSITSSADASRVRGVGGFNFGDTTVIGRYYVREKFDQPRSCMDILLSGNSKGNGSYTIYPRGTAVTVDCDMTTQGGGWTKVWHGYPSHARYNDTSLETYSRSNSIPFNQMRMEGVNIGVNIVDTTFKTAYLDNTIPYYFQQVVAGADAAIPKVKFADFNGTENVELVGNYFFKGYGNNWRVFYTCINVDPGTAEKTYLGGSYHPGCPARSSFVTTSLSTCAGTDYNYCTSSMSSTETDTGLGLTLKQYQETRVWVRSLPTMRSCKEILDKGFASGDGVYLIDPDGAGGSTEPFRAYCDMTSQGGGWTLVWSNTRDGTNKPVTGISYADSISTRPRCSAAQSASNDFTGSCTSILNGSSSNWLEAFNYFVGLKHWDSMTGGADFEMKYRWSADYGRTTDREAVMVVSNFDPANNYALNGISYRNTVGTQYPGIFVYHPGAMWTTFDVDNDAHTSNCGTNYSNTPFWYKTCWNGSMNGGGEASGGTYYNGAYWTGSAVQWGDPATGAGAGNGWIFIRELKSEARLKSSCKEILESEPGSPSGVYTIDITPGTKGDSLVVYCDMTTDGGGWTLVAFSNGLSTAPTDFFVNSYNTGLVYKHTSASTRASINPEAFSLAVGTTDAMFISPSYNSGSPIIDRDFGQWDYNMTKCSGTLYHTSRTAGCSGQSANDNWDTADKFNLTFFTGSEGVVPNYGTELCYSGKGACSFKFFLR